GDRLLELRRQRQERRHQRDQRNHRRRGAGPQPRDQEDNDRAGQQPEFRREREQVPKGPHPPPRDSRVMMEKLMLSIRIAGSTPIERMELVPVRSTIAAASSTSNPAVRPSATISTMAPLRATGAAVAAASSTRPMWLITT